MQKEKGKREVNKPRIRETKHFSKNKKVKEQKVSEQTKDRSTSKNTEPTEQLTTDLTKEEMLRILREEYDSFRRKSLESQSNMPEYDLTDSEIKVLVLLDMVTSSIKRENLFVPSEIPVKIVDRHLIGDFLEMISSDLQISEDVDKILNQLEELELITEKKIANCLLSVEITVDGKKIAEKYKDKYFEEILVALAKYVEEVVDSDELAKRILQILDIVGLSTKRKLENYFTNISTQFEDAILLIIFLLFDDKFRKHHTISKITRKIRKDVPDNKMLEDFCKDDDFLKALAILYMDKIWDRLGIDFVMEDSNPKIIGSIYSYRTIIHKLIDEKCTEILSKLILLGVLGSDKYNIFKLNVIEVLSNNLDRIKSFFKFDASKAKEIISEMDVEMIEDFQFNLEETIELIKCGALIPYDGGLYIRKEFEEMIRERSQEHAAKIAEDTKVEKQPEPTPDITPTKDVEIPEDFEPFKLLFDFEGKTIDFDNPLVICLEETPHDSHIGSVRTICKLIYREKVGGLPDPTIIETIDKPEDLFEQIRAEGRIVSIKLNEKEWGMLTKKDWQKLWSRIKELFAQGFGVVIFNRSLTQLSEHIVNYINLKPRVLPVELKKEIVELFWGVKVPEEVPEQFDLLFEIARIKKEKLLKNLKEIENGIYWDATKADENESELHRQIKSFVVMLIVKELEKESLELKTPTEIEEHIKTEYWVSDDVRADIYFEDDSLKVFEIETLFAEDRGGKIVRDKLRETFKKYENTIVDEINIVLDNFTFVRHLKEILGLKKNFEKDLREQKNKTINFYTIDVENGRLIPLTEVLNRVKTLMQKLDELRLQSAE